MITELPRQQWLEAPGWCGMQTGLCACSRRPPPRGSWTRLAAELPGGPRGVASLPPPQARPRAGYKAGPAWPSAQPAGTLPEPPGGTRLSAPPLLLRPTRGTMRPLWLCWALWALPLSGPGAALSGEQIRGRLLQQLHLSEVPVLDEGDVGELVTPAHVMAQYVALLQRSHRARSRGKRFSQEFREVAGRWLASEASTHLLVFSMERRLPPNSELVRAVLRLFQEPVPRAALRRHERLSPHSARARVTIEWLHIRDDSSNRTSLVDSRLVSLHESGWKAFDVTEAVTFWQQLSRPREPLLLQVTVQREHLGPPASGAHKLVRFASQGPAGTGQGEPQLELHTLDLGAYGAQGDCDPEVPLTEATRCCRQEVYIDLRGMKWAENWVLEPPGFLAYECVGTCQQPPQPLPFKWPFLGPRQCVASETASLPVIVSMKEGGRPRPQVVSLPNMRVQKCSCSWDGAPVPRKLEP